MKNQIKIPNIVYLIPKFFFCRQCGIHVSMAQLDNHMGTHFTIACNNSITRCSS